MSQNHAHPEDSLKESILARTTVVKDVTESAKIVSGIISSPDPIVIAVDMEGIHLPHISLVQVKTGDDRIYLFRTGLCQDIFGLGRLQDLLENPRVTKVMHASVSDCQALHKAGIKIWGLYDTSLAHKVVQFQNAGEPLVFSKVISFNNICEVYNARANPLKESLKDDVWKRAEEFVDRDPLPEDLALYSAYDVEPLLEVHQRTSTLIEPDFRPFLEDLCEIEVVRSIDPELAKTKLKELADLEQNDVFLPDLPKGVGKPQIYEALVAQQGTRRVLFSVQNSSAHVVLSSRKQADQASRELAAKLECKSARLLHEMRPEEVQLSEEEQKKFVERLGRDGYVLDPPAISAVVAAVLGLRCSVVLDLAMKDGNALMELHLGQKTPPRSRLRFHVTKMSINEGGLKGLFESRDAIKVVDRVDSPTALSVFRVLSACGVKPQGFFDVSAAFKMLDFWYHGCSYLSGAAPKLEESLARIGLATDSLENRLIAFLELQEILPAKCLEMLAQKTQVDIDVMCSVPKARDIKKDLRNKFDNRGVHLYGSWRDTLTMEVAQQRLEEYLQHRKLKWNSITMLTSDVMVVEMKYKDTTRALADCIRRERAHDMFNEKECWVTTVGVFKVKGEGIRKANVKAYSLRLADFAEKNWHLFENAIRDKREEVVLIVDKHEQNN